jgi:hypothetical protein
MRVGGGVSGGTASYGRDNCGAIVTKPLGISHPPGTSSPTPASPRNGARVTAHRSRVMAHGCCGMSHHSRVRAFPAGVIPDPPVSGPVVPPPRPMAPASSLTGPKNGLGTQGLSPIECPPRSIGRPSRLHGSGSALTPQESASPAGRHRAFHERHDTVPAGQRPHATRNRTEVERPRDQTERHDHRGERLRPTVCRQRTHAGRHRQYAACVTASWARQENL